MGFRRSVEVVRGPLREELGAVLREMDLGVPWREALDRLAARTDVPALRRVVAALGRSQRLGAGIGATLRTVAQDVRLERQARAEDAARRAPVKMLFPLVFLVLPAFLLLTVGPVVLATIRSLH
jgi:tight adherence protein C